MVAPPHADVPSEFRGATSDPIYHRRLMTQVQRLRGNVYLADGAVQSGQLSRDGRHEQAADTMSWHLIGVDADGEAISCLRYRQYENTVRYVRLGICSSPMARSREWGMLTRMAVERDLQQAREWGVSYVELGGWAIADRARHTCEVLRMVLATYAAWRLLGGGIGVGTVTHRHESASIVKRLGGRPLSVDGSGNPKYSDPVFGCEMELLRFSSEDVAPRFSAHVDDFVQYLQRIPVIQGTSEVLKEKVAVGGERFYQESELLCFQ